jgi:hypothetical protein
MMRKRSPRKVSSCPTLLWPLPNNRSFSCAPITTTRAWSASCCGLQPLPWAKGTLNMAKKSVVVCRLGSTEGRSLLPAR